jgi:hypothetical protein
MTPTPAQYDAMLYDLRMLMRHGGSRYCNLSQAHARGFVELEIEWLDEERADQVGSC